jgi:DNA gyrase subunit A
MSDGGEFRPLAWAGEKVDFADALRDRGIIYARKTILDRALPDVRDGLKPVQRRILFAMFEMGLKPNRKPKKSAKIVGDVMGSYHPHGDSSIYEAMARMAQDFQLNVPLVRGYGEWGSPDDSAAAMRYTEASLSLAGWEAVRHVDPALVRYQENFDGQEQEPTVLPMPFPNILVNGNSGMAYGMTSSYPPHNLAEVMDAALLVADDENVSLKKVMRKLPGPDFPGGGVVTNPDDMHEIYATGRGTVWQQAKFHIENASSSQPKIVVTELPYQVGYGALVESIIKVMEKEAGFEDIADDGVEDYSSDAGGMRIEITCRRGGDVGGLLRDLLKLKTFRRPIGCMFNAIVEHGGIVRPQRLTLLQILREFVTFRRQLRTRRLEMERDEHLLQVHRLDGIIAALDVIDEVIRIIRTSKDTPAAKATLMRKIKYKPHGKGRATLIDEQQAQWILDLRLARLTQLNQAELVAERTERLERLEVIERILATPAELNELVKDEMKAVRDEFGAARQTHMTAIDTAASLEEITAASQKPAEAVTAWISSSGRVLAQPHKGRRASSSAPIKASADSPIACVLEASSDSDLIVITDQGTALLASLIDTEPARSGAGDEIVRTQGERVVGAWVDDANDPAQAYVVMVTEQGKLKRIPREAIASVDRDGVPAYRVDDGDHIVAVVPHGDGQELMIATAAGQLLRTPLDKLRPTKGGAAGGRDAIKLRAGDRVVGALLAAAGALVSVHERGHAKQVAMSEYPAKGIATGGVASAMIDKPKNQPAGEVVAVFASNGKAGSLRVATAGGKLVEMGLEAPVARAVISRPALMLSRGDRPLGPA